MFNRCYSRPGQMVNIPNQEGMIDIDNNSGNIDIDFMQSQTTNASQGGMMPGVVQQSSPIMEPVRERVVNRTIEHVVPHVCQFMLY